MDQPSIERVPNLHGAIVRDRNESITSRVEGDVRDCVRVTIQEHLVPVFRIVQNKTVWRSRAAHRQSVLVAFGIEFDIDDVR